MNIYEGNIVSCDRENSQFRYLVEDDGIITFTRRREEMGGNVYATDNPPMEGWLCPALFRYFDKAPPELYVKAEAKK